MYFDSVSLILYPGSVVFLRACPLPNKLKVLSIFQQSVLNALLYSNPYPTHEEKASLARMIGVNLTTVFNWISSNRKLMKTDTLTKSTSLKPGKKFNCFKTYFYNWLYHVILTMGHTQQPANNQSLRWKHAFSGIPTRVQLCVAGLTLFQWC